MLGDVAGKGMPAALMMAGICPEVRHLVRAGVAPHEVLTKVNRQVCDAEFDCRFVTLVLTELDPRSHRLTVANAGHPFPLIRRSGGAIEEAGRDESGTPLGIDGGASLSFDHRLSRTGRRRGPLLRRSDRRAGPTRRAIRGTATS